MPTTLLCKNCDVYVGFSAAGIAVRPPNRNTEWLRDHCWVCERSVDEVVEENMRREGIDPRGTLPLDPEVIDKAVDIGVMAAKQPAPAHDHNFLSTKGPGLPVTDPVQRMGGVFQETARSRSKAIQDRMGTAEWPEQAREDNRSAKHCPACGTFNSPDWRVCIACLQLLPWAAPMPSAKEVSSVALSTYVDKAMFDAAPMPEEGRDRPRVYLLSATPDPLGAVAAFSMMYEGRVIRNLAEITDDERKHYFDECFKTALQTPLEAIDFHFMIEGMTRATWDQMVRQRTAVFAGESLRFAVKDGLDGSVRPGPGVRTEAQRANWAQAVEAISVAYGSLIANGVPAEDARGLLPLNVLTRGHWKTNLRNLQAEVGKRLCTQAQFEWRLLHVDLRRAIREHNDSYQFTTADGVPVYGGSGWQFQYIADSKMFQPICFQKGACMFKASMDRGCTIRERVDRGAFDEIKTEEWLTDPKAAWVK